MAHGASKMKPKLNTKLKAPKNWPPPPEEVEDVPTISLGFLKALWLNSKAKKSIATGGGLPNKPGWPDSVPLPPPIERKGSHYKIIAGTPDECTGSLNYYHKKNLLIEIDQMCATERITTILIKIYDEY